LQVVGDAVRNFEMANDSEVTFSVFK